MANSEQSKESDITSQKRGRIFLKHTKTAFNPSFQLYGMEKFGEVVSDFNFHFSLFKINDVSRSLPAHHSPILTIFTLHLILFAEI
jgi:hypothetical protein